MDPRVRELDRQMGAERSAEDIQQEYATRLANLNQLISGADTTSAARGVSGAVSALGSALGVEAAPEIAADAGGVSPGDAVTRAMLSGAAAQFASLEQQTLGDRANRLQQMGMSRAEALKAARQERRQTRLQLAELRGQRIAARPNPLERTLAVLQLDQAIKAGSGYGGGGYGGGYGAAGDEAGADDLTSEAALASLGTEAAARAAFRAGKGGRQPNIVPSDVSSTSDYSTLTFPGSRAYPWTGTPGGSFKNPSQNRPGRRVTPPKKAPTPRAPGTPRGSSF